MVTVKGLGEVYKTNGKRHLVFSTLFNEPYEWKDLFCTEVFRAETRLFFLQLTVYSVIYLTEDGLTVDSSWACSIVMLCKVSLLWNAHHFTTIFQSSGTMPESHTSLQRPHIHVIIQSPPVFSISAVMPSYPGDLFFFRHLIVFLVSSAEKSSMTIGRIGGGSSVWAWIAGLGLLTTSLKC